MAASLLKRASAGTGNQSRVPVQGGWTVIVLVLVRGSLRYQLYTVLCRSCGQLLWLGVRPLNGGWPSVADA
jgi:hypothetical protein